MTEGLNQPGFFQRIWEGLLVNALWTIVLPLCCVMAAALIAIVKTGSEARPLRETNSRAPQNHSPRADPHAFLEAASEGDMSALQKQIQLGVELDDTDAIGQTALMLAADFGREAVIKELIRRGANVHARDNYGQTALNRVTHHGRDDLVQLLQSAGAVEPVMRPPTPQKALWTAIEEGRTDRVRTLVAEDRAVVRATNDYGATSLHYALRLKRKAVVRALLELGADPNAIDKFGFTPLMDAFDAEVGLWLLERGARVAAHNSHGVTPLHCAAGGARLDLVRLLLEHGAALDARDDQGQTALDHAVGIASAGYEDKYAPVIAFLRSEQRRRR